MGLRETYELPPRLDRAGLRPRNVRVGNSLLRRTNGGLREMILPERRREA
jgi:hypothetical protein